jgi:hypothetical protein
LKGNKRIVGVKQLKFRGAVVVKIVEMEVVFETFIIGWQDR